MKKNKKNWTLKSYVLNRSLKLFIIYTILFLMLLPFAYGLLTEYICRMIETNADAVYSPILTTMNKITVESYEEGLNAGYTTDQIITDEKRDSIIQFYITGSSFPDIYYIACSYFIDNSTGEIVYAPKDHMYQIMIVEHENYSESFYMLVENSEEITEIYNNILSEYSDKPVSVTIKANEIYAIDGHCYIKSLSVFTIEQNSELLPVENEEIIELNVDIPEGYELYTRSDDVRIFMPMFPVLDDPYFDLYDLYDNTEELFYDLIDWTKDYILSDSFEITKYSYSDLSNTNDFYYAFNEKSHVVFVYPVFTPSGERYTFVYAAYFDLRAITLKTVILVYIIALFILELINLIISLIKGNKIKAQINSDNYRRYLTNALAHDLKTPLTIISGYAESIKANVHEEKREYYADAIMENVVYINDNLEKLLELGKIENLSSVKNTSSMSFKTIAESIIKKYEYLINQNELRFEIKGDFVVKGNEDLLTNAIDNLVLNACKHSLEKSVIDIHMSQKSFVITNVSKKPIETDVKDLLDPLMTASPERTNRSETGLGLSIANNILILHKLKLVLDYTDNKFTATIKK